MSGRGKKKGPALRGNGRPGQTQGAEPVAPLGNPLERWAVAEAEYVAAMVRAAVAVEELTAARVMKELVEMRSHTRQFDDRDCRWQQT